MSVICVQPTCFLEKNCQDNTDPSCQKAQKSQRLHYEIVMKLCLTTRDFEVSVAVFAFQRPSKTTNPPICKLN